MKYRTLTRGWSIAALALAMSGCALTSKAEIVDIRYFSPEQVKPRLDASNTSPARATSPNQVRLGRVTSGPNLRERIAFRDAAYELGYYEDRRWTERPETFVRRELGRTLFEERGFHRVLTGDAPTLEVEVIAFDELKLATGHATRVQLKVVLIGDRDVVFEETLTIDRPVTGPKASFEDVVAAMASALDAACEQVADHVATVLATERAAASAK